MLNDDNYKIYCVFKIIGNKYYIVSNLVRVKFIIVKSLINIYFGVNYIGNFEFYYFIRSLILLIFILKFFNGCFDVLCCC